MRSAEFEMPDNNRNESSQDGASSPEDSKIPRVACPVCGGQLIEIRGKLQCARCHTIIETCCEGGPP
jgi:hypothetical protein